MNDIDDLAAELGIDDNDTNESEAIQPSEITSAAQLKAGDDLIKKCKDIYQIGRENDLAWRWMIGNEVDDAYENEEKYEESILKRMSEELDIAISDLSRFRKFYQSFDKEKIIERAKVGYTWSHFKVINDLPDGDIKKRMIALVEAEDEAPKIKELQSTINEEKNAQFNETDSDSSDGLGGSSGTSIQGGSTPIKPVNASLKIIDKLLDNLTNIFLQEESGIDFDTDTKEEKYNTAMDELNVRINEVIEIHNKIWKNISSDDDDDDDDNGDDDNGDDKS